jgi:hypothetical protein
MGDLASRAMSMKMESNNFRAQVEEWVVLLSSASQQVQYERDVPIADVPAELVCRFVDDLFHPKGDLFLAAFSEREIKGLAELYGMIRIASKAFRAENCHSVADIQKVPEWRAVMAFAKDLAVELKEHGQPSARK